jgi:parallel beta-helix repeat protein
MFKLYKQPKKFVFLLLSSFLTCSGFANIYTVTNTANNGAGSLAQAITDANLNPGLDEIRFNLPANQPCIINLTTALPAIADAVFINGYSQPGSLAGPIATRTLHVNISGAGIAGGDIFTISADNVSIAGLALYQATWYGIKITINDVQNIGTTVDNIHIWGNYIGTDTTGTNTGLGCAQGGILSNSDFFSANTNSGIVIGTNGDGTADANEGNLVTSSSSAGTIDGDGILLWKSSNSRISGNIVGLNKNGTGTGFGNSRDGIVVTVDATTTIIGTDNNGTSDALEGNLIGRNTGRGIFLAGRSSNCIIGGNTIGLDISNALAPNGTDGIEVLNSQNSTIRGNVVSGNTANGIRIGASSFFGFEGPSSGNTITGNFIGTDAGSTLARGNGANGIYFVSSINNPVDNNIVSTNTIANNTLNGIQADASTGGGTVTGNKFTGNLIYNNTALGIDLNGGGVTSNDDGDGDAGANDLLNAPVISSVQVTGGNLVITGFTRPGTVVEFYIPDAGPNPNPMGSFTKNFGEGQTFLFRAQDDNTLGGITDELNATTGTYSGTDEGTGLGGNRTENTFRFTIPVSSLPVAVSAGTRVTGIAYVNATGAGSTSEFGGVASLVVTPVTYTYFKGLLQDGKTQLSWGTGQESNNSHFEVEKSTTGDNFTKIGTVAAKGGWNNQYAFTDASVQAKVNYYRLKQVDLDARSEYSKILVIRADLGSFAVKVGPNPFAGNINVQYQLEKETTVQIRLYDQGGRVVKQYTTRGGAGANTFNISDVNSLSRGNYTLELSGEGVSYRQGMIK